MNLKKILLLMLLGVGLLMNSVLIGVVLSLYITKDVVSSLCIAMGVAIPLVVLKVSERIEK